MDLDRVGAQLGVLGGSGFLDEAVDPAGRRPAGRRRRQRAPSRSAARTASRPGPHGRDHRFPPHAAPCRAHLWALRRLGGTQVVAPCAVGSRRRELSAGSLVVPDQLVDRTSGRGSTYDASGAVHVSFAGPYCPTGRAVPVERAGRAGWDVTGAGTMVVVEGPRFSTRAESRWYADQGLPVGAGPPCPWPDQTSHVPPSPSPGPGGQAP